jgi:hypothetical protein
MAMLERIVEFVVCEANPSSEGLASQVLIH